MTKFTHSFRTMLFQQKPNFTHLHTQYKAVNKEEEKKKIERVEKKAEKNMFQMPKHYLNGPMIPRIGGNLAKCGSCGRG